MKIFGRVLWLTIFPLLFSGCESSPPKKNPSLSLPQSGPDAALLVFLRPSTPPKGVKGNLSVDGRVLGKVFVREYAAITIPPGPHDILFAFPRFTAIRPEAVTINFEAGNSYYLCYSTTMDRGRGMPVAPFVTFTINPSLTLLSEDAAKALMNEFEVAFIYSGAVVPSFAPENGIKVPVEHQHKVTR